MPNDNSNMNSRHEQRTSIDAASAEATHRRQQQDEATMNATSNASVVDSNNYNYNDVSAHR
jgi:hypothetical protein